MKLSNNVYDILSMIQKIVLPAVGTLIFSVFEIWHGDMALAAEITGTVAAVDTFLGVILGISTAQYTAEQAENAEK